MSKKQIKTIVVDNEVRALNRMKLLLNHFPEIEILDLIDRADEAVDKIVRSQPDLVFMDIEMPGKTGLELADEINKHNIETRIIFVSGHDHYAIKAIKNSAFDYLLKPVNIDELKTTIERFKAKLLTNLTKREFEIIRLIGKGLNSKAIGETLFISRHTVDTYRRTILEKTDCVNSAELISYATRNNLI